MQYVYIYIKLYKSIYLHTNHTKNFNFRTPKDLRGDTSTLIPIAIDNVPGTSNLTKHVMGVSKNRGGKPLKMDGENNGKPY